MLLVVGPHRSGTSTVARALECLGAVNSPNLMRPDEANPKGYYEDYDIYLYNDRLLLPALHRIWSSITPVDWTVLNKSERFALEAQALEVVQRNYPISQPISVLKEPRITSLLPFWIPVLQKAGFEVKMVGAVRDPLSVARSLQVRHGFSLTHGSMLYLTMWLEVLGKAKQAPLSFIAFEDVLDEPDQALRHLAAHLHVALPADFANRVADFAASHVEHGLCHRRVDQVEFDRETHLPRAAVDLYSDLLEATHSKNSDKPGKIATTIRRSIGDLNPLLGDFDRVFEGLVKERETAAELGSLRAALAQEQKTVVERTEWAKRLEQELAAATEAHARETLKVEILSNEISALSQSLMDERQLASERTAWAQSLEKEAESRRDAHKSAAQEAEDLRVQLQAALDSTCWKITAPLRWVVLFARRLMERIRRTPQTLKMLFIDRQKGFFDAAWYLHQYPDVREAGKRPFVHYALHGFFEGRAPKEDAALNCQNKLPTMLVRATAFRGRLSRAMTVWKNEGLSGLRSRLRLIYCGASVQGEAISSHGLTTSSPPRALLVSGEPGTPGHVYRVERLAEALSALGWCWSIVPVSSLRDLATGSLDQLDLVWIWRAGHDEALERLVVTCKERGALILYDLDDLMFEPELAKAEVIDAIRSGKYCTKQVAKHYTLIRRAMLLADALTAATKPLAAAMREHFRPVFVIPNTFDRSTWSTSIVETAKAKAQQGSKIVRIGYASGTLTHQKDFQRASVGVAACLRANPHARLVLFKKPGVNMVDLSEFSEFDGLDDQIEWRDFVSMAELPAEIARFDINLAPLEAGNHYVEAKSELKYFEAALVRIPTVASPTAPYTAAIRHGFNGFLANSHGEWRETLHRLVNDEDARRRVGEIAHRHAVAKHGTLAKIHSVRHCLSVMRGSASDKAFAAVAEIFAQQRPWNSPACAESAEVFSWHSGRPARLSIVMPVFNYASFVREALDSAKAQSLEAIDLVVVDDASTDESLAVILEWVKNYKERFTRVAVYSNKSNSGLGTTRNRAFAEAESLFVLPLDADNKLGPNCSERLLTALETSPAAFAYPIIRQFGEATGRMGYQPWNPLLLSCINYIDAMALVNKSAWSAVGGYEQERSGWEDYQFWCRVVEAGYWGLQVPDAIAFYRVHSQSMLSTFTETKDKRAEIARRFREKHPWLDIPGY